jgi:hypothetical protein
VGGERVAGLGAVSGDDLDEAGRQDRVDQLLQPDRAQRGVLGRLDPADDAERLGQGVVEAIEAGRDRVAA